MTKKENNRRRFPGTSNRNRPDRAAKRRDEAKDRQQIHDDMTTQQKLTALDIKFGAGLGAVKERAKLQKRLKPDVKTVLAPTISSVEEIVSQTIPSELMAEIDAINEENAGKKKVKAKDRRALAKKN